MLPLSEEQYNYYAEATEVIRNMCLTMKCKDVELVEKVISLIANVEKLKHEKQHLLDQLGRI